MKDFGVYIFFIILLVLVGLGFYQDITFSNIEVEISNSCFVKRLGITNYDDNSSNVYSYCLEDVNLNKVLLGDNTISYSKLIHNLDKKDCLKDSDTCTYYDSNYKIVSCHSGDIVITTLEDNFDYIYEEFCISED